MSYPPPDHVLTSLGIWTQRGRGGSLTGRADVDVGLLASPVDGQVGMGSIASIVDLVAGTGAARMLRGDWMTTSDMWIHERAPVDPDSSDGLALETTVMREGSKSIVVRCDVEQGERAVAMATVEFTRIRGEAMKHPRDVVEPPDPARLGPRRIGDGPLLDSPLAVACGVRIDAHSGVVELPQSDFVSNSIGTLQGGTLCLMADVAAVEAARRSRSVDGRARDLHMRFLAQTGLGPAITEAEIVRAGEAGTTVGVEIVDSSADRLVGWAMVQVS